MVPLNLAVKNIRKELSECGTDVNHFCFLWLCVYLSVKAVNSIRKVIYSEKDNDDK